MKLPYTKTQERCEDMVDEHSLFRAAGYFFALSSFIALVYYTIIFIFLGSPPWLLG